MKKLILITSLFIATKLKAGDTINVNVTPVSSVKYTINLLGQLVDSSYSGVVIYIYSDGTRLKWIQNVEF